MVFSQQLFESNDPICRRKILDILGNDHIVENTKDKYGIDILLNRSDLFVGIELERIYSWTTESIPLNRPRLIERKYKKYNNNVLFLQFNNDLSKICIFTKAGVNIKDSRVITRGDKSYGTYNNKYEVHKSTSFTFDKIINYYKRINKKPTKIKKNYCQICKCNVSDIKKHIKRENHITNTQLLNENILEEIKCMTLKSHFKKLGLVLKP